MNYCGLTIILPEKLTALNAGNVISPHWIKEGNKMLKEDRKKFIVYLQDHIQSNELLIKQMKKLPNLELVIKTYSDETNAFRIVLQRLKQTEDF